jgi:hypothetical protein
MYKAIIVLYLSVAANNAFGFQLNPRQKLDIIFIIVLANGCEFWQWHLQLRDWCQVRGHSVSAGAGSKWIHATGYELLHGITTSDKFSRLDKGNVSRVIVGTIEWGIHPKLQTTHV